MLCFLFVFDLKVPPSRANRGRVNQGSCLRILWKLGIRKWLWGKASFWPICGCFHWG